MNRRVLCLPYIILQMRIIDDMLYVCLVGCAAQFVTDRKDMTLPSFNLGQLERY
jgi:hypothetical protein